MTERNGELALANLLIGECILRQTPVALAVGANAIEAGKMEENLNAAVEVFDAFASGPLSPQTADGLLKLGITLQRLADLQAVPAEKAKTLKSAKEAYQRLLGKEFPADNPFAPQAMLELAKCLSVPGVPGSDVWQAIRLLQPFTTEPLKNNSIAPMAVIQLATIFRSQNKSADAAEILSKCREGHETGLAKDPERAGWVGLLRYHHGVALRESGKLPEARTVFDLVVKQAPAHLEGVESALRLGQCLKDEALQLLTKARSLPPTPGKNPYEAAEKMRGEGYKNLKDAAELLEKFAGQLKDPASADVFRARMLYEAAWCYRILAEPEVAKARADIAQEMAKKLGNFPLPGVPLDQVPLQPSEKKARELYDTLIKNNEDLPLATDARFELAELFALRRDFDPAFKLLNDVLDKEPSPDLTDRVRIRLGEVHLSKGNLKQALAQFDAVAQNPKGAMLGLAQYGAAEVFLAQKQPTDAIKRLTLFTTLPALQNQSGLTDRALLRLGHAQAQVKNWSESQRIHGLVITTYPYSPWIDEARYGQAFALQQSKELDKAASLFAQVAARTASQLGAQAQLQIGLIKLEQKKYPEAITALLTVPTTYNYPELSAAALVEAAQAHAEAKQNTEAVRLLERVIQEYPTSSWANTARERLKGLQPK